MSGTQIDKTIPVRIDMIHKGIPVKAPKTVLAQSLENVRITDLAQFKRRTKAIHIAT